MHPRRLSSLAGLVCLTLATAPLSAGLLAPPGVRGENRSAAAGDVDSRRLIGVWALTDSRNNLFNVRIHPDGQAVSTVGTAGVPFAGAKRLTDAQLRQVGRWKPWGNGIRVDYNDGWTDWIYVGPAGLSHASWQPGQNRGDVPFNFGTAVQLSGDTARVVGVYSFPPAQESLKPYTATLLSNGQAFNNIDSEAGGVWRLKGDMVVIQWISGWRTTMSLAPATPLQLKHWAPGADRGAPPTGGIRQAQRVE